MQIKPNSIKQLKEFKFPRNRTLLQDQDNNFYIQLSLNPFDIQSGKQIQICHNDKLQVLEDLPILFKVNPLYFCIDEIKQSSYQEYDDVIFSLKQKYNIQQMNLNYFDVIEETMIKFSEEKFLKHLKQQQFLLEKQLDKNKSLLFLKLFLDQQYIEKHFGRIQEEHQVIIQEVQQKPKINKSNSNTKQRPTLDKFLKK